MTSPPAPPGEPDSDTLVAGQNPNGQGTIGMDIDERDETALSTDDTRPRELIKSVEKSFAVLRLFSTVRQSLTIAQIAQQVGISRPAIRRILVTLEYLGYTHQHGTQWSLTPRVLELGSGYFSKTSLPEIAEPYLQIVVDKIDETCHIGVWDRHEVVHVARIEVPRVVPDSIHIGTRLPAYATAIGLVLLANLSEEELREYFRSTELVALTAETIVSESEIRARLAQINADGYALTKGDLASGTSGLAVPITAAGKVVGSLGITSTFLRHSPEDLESNVLPILIGIGAEISYSYELNRRRRID